MTLDTFIDQNAGTIVLALIAAIPGTIGAIGTFWNGRRAKVTREILRQGIQESASHAEDVKCEVRAIRPGVKHDLENGVGTVMAQKVVEHMAPVLAANATVLAAAVKEDAQAAAQEVVNTAVTTAQEVANTAAATTASLAASQPMWDGVERRRGTTAQQKDTHDPTASRHGRLDP